MVQNVYVHISYFEIYSDVIAFYSWTLYVFGALHSIKSFRILCYWRAEWGTKVGYVSFVKTLVRFPTLYSRDSFNNLQDDTVV